MKGSLVVVAFFCAGCMIGAVNNFQYDMHSVSMYVLYALMLQVGISIGSNKKLKELIKSLRLKMLLVPIATITGTLLFSALASLLLSQWSVFDCMAVGSGFAYYSLSSILITQFKEPSIGLQLATELGTIALLANIFREMMALLGAPLIRKYFGQLAPISAAGVNSKSGKTKRATLQKRRVSKSTKTTRTRKTVSPVLSCMTKAHRFLFV